MYWDATTTCYILFIANKWLITYTNPVLSMMVQDEWYVNSPLLAYMGIEKTAHSLFAKCVMCTTCQCSLLDIFTEIRYLFGKCEVLICIEMVLLCKQG